MTEIVIPEGKKIGSLCKLGHKYLNLNQSLRYADGHCVDCVREKSRLNHKDPVFVERQNALRKTSKHRAVKRLSVAKRRALKKLAPSEPYTLDQLRDRFAFLGSVCIYCGSPDNIRIDHIVAINQGGADALWNLAPACERCNCSKGDRPVEEWYRQQPFFDEYSLDFLLGRVD